MKQYISDNKESYYETKPPFFSYGIMMISLFISVLLFGVCQIEIYDTPVFTGVYNAEQKIILVPMSLDCIKKLTSTKKLKINEEEMKLSVANIGEIKITSTLQNYQEVSFRYEGNLLRNNESVEIKLFQKKEKILWKIWNQIKKGV